MNGARRHDSGIAIWGLCLVLLGGCATSYIDDYRSRHPGWQPELPKAGIDLEEVLAALHHERDIETIDVTVGRLDVLRSDVEPWVAHSFEAIRSGASPLSPDRDSVVLAELRCTYNPGISPRTVSRWGIYLLPGGRLEAWDHPSFRERCEASSSFLPLREAHIAMERGAIEALRARGGSIEIGLRDAYRRGFAFVEAGRLEDARAMLVVGEQMRRGLMARARDRGVVPPELGETASAREKLMRALGLEPIPAPGPSRPR